MAKSKVGYINRRKAIELYMQHPENKAMIAIVKGLEIAEDPSVRIQLAIESAGEHRFVASVVRTRLRGVERVRYR